MSPQWGDNSKADIQKVDKGLQDRFQSPQWGRNSKVMVDSSREVLEAFQSPQWGRK